MEEFRELKGVEIFSADLNAQVLAETIKLHNAWVELRQWLFLTDDPNRFTFQAVCEYISGYMTGPCLQFERITLSRSVKIEISSLSSRNWQSSVQV